MSVKIIIPGPLTTIQDRGRLGFAARGFSPSGAADEESLLLANLLVGNTFEAAAFEMTLGGLGVQITEACVIALTGAKMKLHINGNPAESYKAIRMNKGDYLYCEAAKEGCRAYLAVSGGLDVPVVLGSRSTSLKLKLGGFEGQKLKPGDLIPVGKQPMLTNIEKRRLSQPDFPKEVTLRAVRGPQDDMFSEGEIQKLISSVYTVSPTSDRMGIRFTGEKLAVQKGVDIISDGIVNGSVQIPKDGTPILLIADHQTTGGYAKPVTVISVDLPKAAQLTPGCKVHFEEVSLKEAQRLYLENQKALLKLQKKMN